MRLIDADELKRALKSNCTPELCHDINTAWCDSCCRTNDFEDLIDNAPTVARTERPLIMVDGKVIYITQEHIDALIDFETKRQTKEVIERFMDSLNYGEDNNNG